jgi:Flp pilus assembly protein TadG
MLAKLLTRIWRARSSFASSEGGNVLLITGLSLPVLLGIAGLGVEGAAWYTERRAMQNAADAAVVAAASNASANYQAEARAVTARLGFTNGTANTTVTAANAVTCPGGASGCYSVTVTRDVPLVFSRVVGYTGSVTVGGAPAIRISTTAIATQAIVPREYCILALGDGSGTSAVDFLSNGGPHADLSGCNVASNSSMTCNGHDLNADFGDAAGTNNGCGNVQSSNMPTVPDPYAALASNIPSNPCGSYPGVTWAGGTRNLTGTTTICGTLTLSGNVTLTGSGVIVIYNGNLELYGNSLSTADDASVTIVFSGTNTGSHVISESRPGNQGNMLNIEAPTTGPWSGIAIYQAPHLTTGVDMEFAGNNPTFNITGVVYLPEADLTFSGAINKANGGAACLVLVIETIRINGTAAIADSGACEAAGVTMPEGAVAGRGRLVD